MSGHVNLRDRWSQVLVHIAVVAPVLVSSLMGVAPHSQLILGGALVLVGYPIIVVLEFRLAPLVLTPLSYLFFWHWLMLGVAAVWKGLDFLEGLTAIPYSVEAVSAADVAAGYSLYLLGILVLHAGVTVLRPIPGNSDCEPPRPFRLYAFAALWAAGLAARLLRPWMVWLGGLVGVLSYGSLAAICALALDEGERRIHPRRYWSLLLGGVAFEFVLGLLFNSKGEATRALLPLAWVALRSRRPIRNAGAIFLAATILYGGVVAPITELIRQERLVDADTRMVSADDLISSGGGVGESEEGRRADLFLDRIFCPTPVGYLVSQARLHGFRNGESMDYLLYAFVPRLLWPDKPIVTRGQWFDAYINQGSAINVKGNSLGQTNAGELYWNFGLLGVISGMFVMGLLLALVWRMAGTGPQDDPFRMVLYVDLILTTSSMLETEFGSALVGMIYRLVVFGTIIKLTTSRRMVAAISLVTAGPPVRGEPPVRPSGSG